MRLLFLNPPGPRYLYRGSVCTYISKARYVWKPKDFILLSSVVPPEWPIDFLDASIDSLGRAETLRRAQELRPEAIIVAMSSIVWEDDLSFLGDLRRVLARTRLLAFGDAFLSPAFRAQARPWLDGIVDDPLRFPVTKLLGGDGLDQRRLEPKSPGKKQAAELSTHASRQSLFDNRRYRWPFVRRFRFASVYTQFGCPFSCSYCTESKTDVTFRPADNVLEELRRLKDAGYRELVFGDASFGFPTQNARRILEGMIGERMDFGWSAYTYPGLLDDAALDRVAASGGHTLVIGVDSADEALLARYGRRLPQAKIREFAAACRRRGVEVCGDFILGFKEETLASCLRSIELAVELDLDYASFNIATPLLGSSIRDDYEARGLIGAAAAGFDTAGLSRIHGTEALPAPDLLWLRNHAVRRFYLRPGYWLKRLRRLNGLEDLRLKTDEGFGILLNLLKAERTLRDGYL